MAKENKYSLDSLLDSSLLHSPAYKIADSLNDDSLKKKFFPVEIRGAKGSLNAFFIKLLHKRISFSAKSDSQYLNKKNPAKDYFIIVPTSRDADEVECDLNTAFSSTAQIFKLPWWGAIPYKAAAKNSIVFGQRAFLLSQLSSHNYDFERPRIFIIEERAFLSPLPPLKYLKKNIIQIRKGQSLDIKEVENQISKMGYLRVSRVSVPGEFAVRGEVIDIFMPGQTYARRIQFDFDQVEKIKSFNAETQVSQENFDSLMISPMKEVIWDDSLVQKLDDVFNEENLNSIQNDFADYDLLKKSGNINLTKDGKENISVNSDEDFDKSEKKNIRLSFTKKALEKKEELLTELSVNRESEGEELFYPFLFDKKYSILDYVSEDSLVFFYDFDRLLNSPKLILNEYNFSYRTSRQEWPVLPPEDALFDFEKLISQTNNSVFFRTLDTLENENLPDDLRTASLKEDTLPKESASLTQGATSVKAQILENGAESLTKVATSVKEDFLQKNAESLTDGTASLKEQNLQKDAASLQAAPAFVNQSPLTEDSTSLAEGTAPLPKEADATDSNLSSYNIKTHFDFHSNSGQSYFGNINYFKEELTALQKDKWHVFIFADNKNQSLRLHEVFKEFIEVQDNKIFPLEIFNQPITRGFTIPDEKILVIQENEIFGRRKGLPKSNKNVKSKAIDTFIELKPGDFVVHVNYGIGLFKGIERIKSLGMERDYIKLEYLDQEYAFVPIEQLNMVQRYIGGGENSKPSLDKLGSKNWANRKAKVNQKVEEIAEKLIDIYSKRQASRGYAFPKDTEWQSAFEAAFPYEDTPDQFQATLDIKNDMESNVPMDRLVCGDVGYGKTEIALRAAFKAVMGGKQVAFLAPTTILAEQHYENALERFKNFPVKIAHLSRFVPASEQKQILEKVAAGKIDILIGTHRIIQKDVVFRDLGLFIVDEEQRFGVKDKERLKELKSNIDCLALSATPIPRTLHMSLLKIRDMSLLATAPQSRLPVQTVIEEYNDERVAQAIRAEIKRGGQVFYLHNRVESLAEVMAKLENLLPEVLIEYAHGQMTSNQLDEIFRRFKMGGFHVLLSTTIIENGIDIPNVNTIIIDRADMYGVSQLYQLRGRVGRSDKKAYAYFFYPQGRALNEVAMKRLQVISDFTELGSGFKIAMKDMEIRGAGNLLGKDQSGEVYSVGFEMYLTLLNAAIERLTKSGWEQNDELLLELEYTGFIPNTYIDEAEIKMEVYKKIASIKEESEYLAILNELEDRFGPLPDEVNSLLCIAKIKILCRKLKIDSLKERRGVVTIIFNKKANISIDKMMALLKTNANKIKLNPLNTFELQMFIQDIDIATKTDFISEKLEMLL